MNLPSDHRWKLADSDTRVWYAITLGTWRIRDTLDWEVDTKTQIFNMPKNWHFIKSS